MQSAITVAIQGDRASFHEIAAKKYYSQPVIFRYCQTFAQVFEALEAGLVNRAFVATQNSAHGTLQEVDALRQRYQPLQEGVHHEKIRQHIIGLPGADLRDIREVISHPVALSQCDVYLRERLSSAQLTPYHDTAAAISLVKATNDTSLVAIGSAEAAALYNLQIIVQDIQTDPDNQTTFVSLIK